MRFDLGAISIDEEQRALTRDGEAVPVEPLVFDAILYLIRHRDRVVTKAEMVDAIWSGRAISDATLSSCVRSARRALGDDGKTQAMIKTFHRRGFRFVGLASVAAVPAEPPPPAPADLDLTLPARPSIAVLPFATLAAHADQRLLANGLVQDITSRLARTRWLFVTARASAERFRAQADDPAAVGRALGVRYLLHGSVIRSADRFRTTVALTETDSGYEVWSQMFDRNLSDLFAVQDEICDLLVSGVESGIALQERQAASLRPIASLDAWGAYHRANDFLFDYSPGSRAEAAKLLDHAARLDPASARVTAAQSFLKWQDAFFEATGDRAGDVRQAMALGERAVGLDPLDPQAHWALGRAARLVEDMDYSVEELATAVDLNPSYANAHYSLGSGLKFQGRMEVALASVERARRISPYDPMMFSFMSLMAELNGLLGDHAAAAKWSMRAARSPNAHYNILAIAAWCHYLAGDRAAADAYLAETRRRRPDYSLAVYFRAFPFLPAERAPIEAALRALGLPE